MKTLQIRYGATGYTLTRYPDLVALSTTSPTTPRHSTGTLRGHWLADGWQATPAQGDYAPPPLITQIAALFNQEARSCS